MASRSALSAERLPTVQEPDLATNGTSTVACTMRRQEVNSAAVAYATSARMEMTLLWIPQGMLISNISFMSGSIAGATLTHCWYGLYSDALAKLAVTTDDTTAAWAVNTVRTRPITGGFTTTYSGLYYLAFVVVGTTMPTLMGNGTLSTFVNALTPVMHGSSTTGQTVPGSAPATAAAVSNLANIPWGWCT